MRALYVAAAGMRAQQVQTEAAAHNLANLNTPGFKRGHAAFREVLEQELGQGVRVAATEVDAAPGALVATGRPLDLAVAGAGLFRLQAADGSERYTRAGTFTVGPDGILRGPGGLPVLGEAGPLAVPPGTAAVRLAPDGTLLAAAAGQPERAAGRLTLAVFPEPGGLAPQGENLWAWTPAAGAPAVAPPGTAGAGALVPGVLEQSNVDLGTEMAGLIKAQRLFQFNAKALQMADEMFGIANGIRRG